MPRRTLVHSFKLILSMTCGIYDMKVGWTKSNGGKWSVNAMMVCTLLPQLNTTMVNNIAISKWENWNPTTEPYHLSIDVKQKICGPWAPQTHDTMYEQGTCKFRHNIEWCIQWEKTYGSFGGLQLEIHMWRRKRIQEKQSTILKYKKTRQS